MNLKEAKLICPVSDCKTKLEVKMNSKNYWQSYCSKCNSNPDLNKVLEANKAYLIHDIKSCREQFHPTEFNDIDIQVCEGCEFKVDKEKLKLIWIENQKDLQKVDITQVTVKECITKKNNDKVIVTRSQGRAMNTATEPDGLMHIKDILM